MAFLGICLLLTVVAYLICVLPIPVLCQPLSLRETTEACGSATFTRGRACALIMCAAVAYTAFIAQSL